jgi:hypothetical protein
MASFGIEIALARLDFGDTGGQFDCFVTLMTLLLSVCHISISLLCDTVLSTL